MYCTRRSFRDGVRRGRCCAAGHPSKRNLAAGPPTQHSQDQAIAVWFRIDGGARFFLKERLRAAGLPSWNRGYLRRTPDDRYWTDVLRESAKGQVVAAMLVDMPGEWHNGLLSLGIAERCLLAACFPLHVGPTTRADAADRQAGDRDSRAGWFNMLDDVISIHNRNKIA